MDRVNFLTIEFGKDLILSFSFNEDSKCGIGGFTIIRTPVNELFLSEKERCPLTNSADFDRRICLRSAIIDRNSIVLHIDNGIENFDISRIDDTEFEDMIHVLKEMNFDNAFDLIY